MEYSNATNLLEETSLIEAISSRKYDLAQRLILAGADVNIVDESQVTPLHNAIAVPELAHLLIKYGANIDAVNLMDQTPLHFAVASGCLESVSMLLYYNADANYRDWQGYTPFMRAVESGKIEMQEALIEYVADFNDSTHENRTILGLALDSDSPFMEEMIKRGADVNNVNGYPNAAFYLSLKHPINLKTIKLIWMNIDYESSDRSSILAGLFLFVGNRYFEQVLDIIVQGKNFSQVAESVCLSDDLNVFTYRYANAKLPLEKYTKIICMLLTHGYTPNNYDMNEIFNIYGYCELYRLLLFMDVRIKDDNYLGIPDKIPTRLMYDVQFSMHKLLGDLVRLVKKGDEFIFVDSLDLAIVKLLDYCVHPKLMEAYLNLKKTDCATLKIKALPKVPSLLELARNATRDRIIDSFCVTNSCQLHTLINNLDISDVYKQILTFKTALYKPTFTANEHESFTKMFKKYEVIENLLSPFSRMDASTY